MVVFLDCKPFQLTQTPVNTTPTDSQQELLLICGMHRSGTSLVTKCFEVFGYGLGETLMEPSADNPKGFFEDLDVVYINDWLLRDNGSYWDAPVFIDQAPVRWDDKHLAAAREIMAAKLERSPCLAVKDPRVCLLLPFWRTVAESLQVSLRLCLVYRNPLDIAASLARRNNLPQSVSFALIQCYWSQLLLQTDSSSFVVSYDGFLERPGDTLDRIAAWLQRPADAGRAGHFMGEFLESSMRHHTHSLEDLRQAPSIDPTLLAAAELLERRSRDETAPRDAWGDAAIVNKNAFSALFAHRLSDRLALLEASTAELELLTIEHAQRGFDLEDLTRQKSDREAHIALLEDRVSEAGDALSVSQAFADDRVKALARTQTDFEHATQALQEEKFRSQSLATDLTREVEEKSLLAKQLEHEEANTKELAQAITLEREQNEELTGTLKAEQAIAIQLKASLASAEASLRALHQENQSLDNKANWLFSLLEADYGRLLQYENSLLGRIHRLGRRGYRLLTLQMGRATAYDNTLAAAATFFKDHGLVVPERQPRKWRQILTMTRYTLAHPISSLRSVSPARLRRVLSVVKSSDAQDLETWVEARFPEAAEKRAIPDFLPITPDELLVFPNSDQPKVSIVIPVYNEWVITHRCLWSILQYTQGEYEVIVADDCSTDETANILDFVTGITVVRHDENQRFLKNCNIAAKQARGELLLFLNNDTVVTEGWLEPLVALFDSSDVGIVGPKLLFPDGKLQEAGGIIWQDGSGWNYGRADDPSRPQYNYVRESDYVSGAALMIRHSLWVELDGFDETFVPAYYEDTDLCFSARQAGYKVLYQPASSVVHFEGMTNGTDLAAGQKQYQVTNQARFLNKWQPALEDFHYPNAEAVPRARDRSRHKKSVLIIDHYVPHYDKDAGSRSTWMYIELMLDMGWRVQFMGANFFPHQPYTEKLQQKGVEVLVGEHLARNLDTWLSDNLCYVDHIFLHRPHIAEQFLPHLKKQPCCPPIAYVGHDLHFLRTEREYQLTGDERLVKQAENWKKRERSVIEAADRTLYFSAIEVNEVLKLVPGAHVQTIPLYVLESLEIEPETTDIPELLFVAGFNHPPNIDAAVWFVENVLPLIRAQVGPIHFNIAGSNPSGAVLELARDDITVHGYVTDERLLELYRRAACAVVPLRFGAGVKGKVLEAIQHGVPLVTTTVGAEGISAADQVMGIADDADAFAVAVTQRISQREVSPDDRNAWLAAHFSRDRAAADLNGLVIAPP